MMKIENPIAFNFIMQDDLYLLSNDKALYNNLDAVPEPDMEEQTPPVIYNYSGGYKKKFLIICHYTGLDTMVEKHLIALQSILNRMGFTLDDVALFNSANYPDVKINALMDFFKPGKLLLLGNDSLPAGMETLVLNKIVQLGLCPALFSFSFDEMMDDQVHKKIFWEELKRL